MLIDFRIIKLTMSIIKILIVFIGFFINLSYQDRIELRRLNFSQTLNEEYVSCELVKRDKPHEYNITYTMHKELSNFHVSFLIKIL